MDFLAEINEYDSHCYVGRWLSRFGWVTHRRLGEGPGLVVIPGIASTYRGYAPILNRLSRSFETVVFDYPGEHRDDESDLSAIRHENLVENLLGLVDHLELDRPSLFGPSFGSTILLGALIQAPGRFGRSVTQGGFVHRKLGPLERLALSIGRRIPGTLAAVPFRKSVLALKNRAGFQGNAEKSWPIYLEQNGFTPIGPLAQRLDLVADLDLRPKLSDVTTEVLALQGSEDRVIGRSEWEVLCRAVPRAEGRLLEGVGHQPHFTHPERLASIIEEWVSPDRVAKPC